MEEKLNEVAAVSFDMTPVPQGPHGSFESNLSGSLTVLGLNRMLLLIE